MKKNHIRSSKRQTVTWGQLWEKPKQMEKHKGEDQKKDETCKADKGDSTYPWLTFLKKNGTNGTEKTFRHNRRKFPLNYGRSYCAPRIRVRQATMNLVSFKEKGRVGAQRKMLPTQPGCTAQRCRCQRTGNHVHRAPAQKLTSGQVAAYVQKQWKTFLNMQTCRNISPLWVPE